MCLAAAALAALAAGSAATAEPACDSAAARSALAEYVRAFNGGHYMTLHRLFAQESEFAWYSVAPPHGRTNQEAQNRSTLMRYLRARHAKREVLRVVRFSLASVQERNGALIANINGTLTRRAVDLPIERRGFKGSIRCGTSAQFIVFSIGTKI